jgi:hypothetical protein
MSQPVYIDFPSIEDVGPADRIAVQAQGGRHVVLRFPGTVSAADKAALIARLSQSLPEFSVFDSGGRGASTHVTVMPVISRQQILERQSEARRAIEDYRRTCARLIERYRSGSLSADWQADEHGEHCRFENRRSGQVVEAPLEDRIDASQIDPYFFAQFLRTTPGHEPVADLITHDFHDAARLLDVLTARGGA